MRLIIPPGMEATTARFAYAPGLISGGFLFMAGQLGRDDAGEVIADPEAQITRAWENVRSILEAAGLGILDIVDITTFHVGLREHLPVYRRVRDRVMEGHTPPWTAIGVSELSREGLIVEIKCTARVPRAAP